MPSAALNGDDNCGVSENMSPEIQSVKEDSSVKAVGKIFFIYFATMCNEGKNSVLEKK